MLCVQRELLGLFFSETVEIQTVMWRRDIIFENMSDYDQKSATTHTTSKSMPWESVFGETSDLHFCQTWTHAIFACGAS